MQTLIIQSKIQLLILNIYLISYEFPDVFFKHSATLVFFVLFWFNLKKKSFRKSRYLLSPVEFFDKIIDVYIDNCRCTKPWLLKHSSKFV